VQSRKIRIAVLGAGPAGLALAMKLLRRPELKSEVVVIEQNPYVGGITASFEDEGLIFDYGSHRLHPSTAEDILQDIRDLLGPDLLTRPRDGRIRLLGRFVKFPLNLFDLALHLPLSFLIGIGLDTTTKLFRRKRKHNASYADVLLNGLGQTICNTFYFPYAHKLWKLNPEEISAVQAYRRISANNVTKIVRKALSVVPGFRYEKSGFFYYPSKGFGEICEAMAQEVERLGGMIKLSRTVREVHLLDKGIKSITVGPSDAEVEVDKSQVSPISKDIPSDLVFSTIPITDLVNSLRPEPPKEISNACKKLQYRGMVFCYLVLETNYFTPYDAHYFPESDFIFSRMYEPKHYNASQEPRGITGLCFEIPCSYGDEIWNTSEDAISDRIVKDLEHAGLPIQSLIKAKFIRRLPKIYPVYDLDYESRFQLVDGYLSQISGLVSLGRQGLFVHDNIHHAIEMAYRASECLRPDLSWDSELWQRCREQFAKYVVED
jgi:protoporphyrinogen oxidase